MTCLDFEKDLALYVEHDLPAAAVPAMEAHLRDCAACRTFLDELRASQALVKDFAADGIDADALAAVRSRAVAAAVAQGRRSPVRRPWLALWAAAVIVTAGTGLWLALAAARALRAPRSGSITPTSNASMCWPIICARMVSWPSASRADSTSTVAPNSAARIVTPCASMLQKVESL